MVKCVWICVILFVELFVVSENGLHLPHSHCCIDLIIFTFWDLIVCTRHEHKVLTETTKTERCKTKTERKVFRETSQEQEHIYAILMCTWTSPVHSADRTGCVCVCFCVFIHAKLHLNTFLFSVRLKLSSVRQYDIVLKNHWIASVVSLSAFLGLYYTIFFSSFFFFNVYCIYQPITMATFLSPAAHGGVQWTDRQEKSEGNKTNRTRFGRFIVRSIVLYEYNKWGR